MRRCLGATAEAKADGTLVTDADKQINALVSEAVAGRGDLMLGEEDDEYVAPTSGRVWVCDPVDGTWLFAAGVPGPAFFPWPWWLTAFRASAWCTTPGPTA